MAIEVVLQTRCGCRRTLWLPKRVPMVQVPLKTPVRFDEEPIPDSPKQTTRQFNLVGNDQILALPLYQEA